MLQTPQEPVFIENWYSTQQLQDLRDTYFRCKDRVGAVIEIGCWEGKSAIALARACAPEPLICIDTWEGNIAESLCIGFEHPTVTECKRRDVYGRFMANMTAGTAGNFIAVREDCLKWLDRDDQKIKFCHVDASHEYESVHATISKLLPKMVPGGVLCGDDYLSANCQRTDLHGGVERAVRELLPGHGNNGNLWFWTCPAMVSPISFCIPEHLIQSSIPVKTIDFARYVPGEKYSYDTQSAYYQGYQEAYFGITTKKGGWDCLRHYEILANGCVPYFVDLDRCPPTVMTHLPKALILEAMRLPGVDYARRTIDHAVFPFARYREIVTQLLVHCREHLTTTAMAKYVLRSMGTLDGKKVLFLSAQQYPDYMRCLLLHGFRTLLGDGCTDEPRVNHLYDDYPVDAARQLYGCGFTYSRTLKADCPVDRSNIENKIRAHYYDAIIFGSAHRGGNPHMGLCLQYYKANEIALICGEDTHTCGELDKPQPRTSHLFVRE